MIDIEGPYSPGMVHSFIASARAKCGQPCLMLAGGTSVVEMFGLMEHWAASKTDTSKQPNHRLIWFSPCPALMGVWKDYLQQLAVAAGVNIDVFVRSNGLEREVSHKGCTDDFCTFLM
jgi:hypothetical protein